MNVSENLTICSGIVTAVCDNRAFKRYVCEDDKPLTLGDIRMLITNGEETDDTILVIHEQPLSGVVYRYGNHGEMWEQIGKTEGFA